MVMFSPFLLRKFTFFIGNLLAPAWVRLTTNTILGAVFFHSVAGIIESFA
jgi:hypothetical protein